MLVWIFHSCEFENVVEHWTESVWLQEWEAGVKESLRGILVPSTLALEHEFLTNLIVIPLSIELLLLEELSARSTSSR